MRMQPQKHGAASVACSQAPTGSPRIIKDQAGAVAWYRKTAEQGLAGAKFSLGCMLGAGTGIAKDEAGAAVWYRKAADSVGGGLAGGC